MNIIRQVLHPKMMTIWSLITKKTKSYRAYGVVLLFVAIFFSMMDHVSAEGLSPVCNVVVNSSPRLDNDNSLLKELPGIGNSVDGLFALSTQTQITPTVSSYPPPLSPTIDSTNNPLGEIEEPYPGLTPDSGEQQLIPYPDRPDDQIQGSSANSEFAQTPTSQNPVSPPSIGSNNTENTEAENIEQAQTSSAVSAVILWIGFLASLMIFLSAILWSILSYSRQRSRE